MTYLEAVGIKQDLIVNLQYADVLHKKPVDALAETAAKYTPEQYQEAYRVIKNHLKKEIEDVKELFVIAIKSQGLEVATKNKPSRRKYEEFS